MGDCCIDVGRTGFAHTTQCPPPAGTAVLWSDLTWPGDGLSEVLVTGRLQKKHIHLDLRNASNPSVRQSSHHSYFAGQDPLARDPSQLSEASWVALMSAHS